MCAGPVENAINQGVREHGGGRGDEDEDEEEDGEEEEEEEKASFRLAWVNRIGSTDQLGGTRSRTVSTICRTDALTL